MSSEAVTCVGDSFRQSCLAGLVSNFLFSLWWIDPVQPQRRFDARV